MISKIHSLKPMPIFWLSVTQTNNCCSVFTITKSGKRLRVQVCWKKTNTKSNLTINTFLFICTELNKMITKRAKAASKYHLFINTVILIVTLVYLNPQFYLIKFDEKYYWKSDSACVSALLIFLFLLLSGLALLGIFILNVTEKTS